MAFAALRAGETVHRFGRGIRIVFRSLWTVLVARVPRVLSGAARPGRRASHSAFRHVAPVHLSRAQVERRVGAVGYGHGRRAYLRPDSRWADLRQLDLAVDLL